MFPHSSSSRLCDRRRLPDEPDIVLGAVTECPAQPSIRVSGFFTSAIVDRFYPTELDRSSIQAERRLDWRDPILAGEVARQPSAVEGIDHLDQAAFEWEVTLP